MLGSYGAVEFGSTEFSSRRRGGKRIAVVGDVSTHGGTVTSSEQDETLLVKAAIVAVDGAQHSCPVKGHGVTGITAITAKSYHNGKLILTQGAIAGCGARLNPIDRKVYVE